MDANQETAMQPLHSAAQPLLRFQVSLNEEHAYLRIALGAQPELDLGERVHHYSLLTLARRRMSDAQRGIDASSQGWMAMDQLSHMLGLDPAHLNIQIHRARSQIARALPPGAALPAIVERRRGELRLGEVPFQIVRGSALEGECQPPAPGHPV
jgi:hypothetical protein